MRIANICLRVAGIGVLVLAGLGARAQGLSKLEVASGAGGANPNANVQTRTVDTATDANAETPHVAPYPPDAAKPAANEQETEPIVERYPDGSVKIERHVMKDAAGNYINHGSYTAYDTEGRVQKTGMFFHGKQQGKWTQTFARDDGHLFSAGNEIQYTGPFVSEATFVNGQLDGVWTIKDQAGQNIVEWAFDHGDRTGRWNWWYPNGKKRLEAIYKNGKLDGELIECSQDGQATAKTTFINGRQLAKVVGWYTLGQKHFEGYNLRVISLPEPIYDWWNATATTGAAATTGEDQKHGAWVEWYRSGKKKIEAQYDHGMPVGKFVWWYENGQKQAEVEYQGGVLHGAWITWHPNGQKESQAEYRDGKVVDKWMHWDADGKLVEVRDSNNNNVNTNRVPSDVPHYNHTTTRQWPSGTLIRNR